MNGWARHSVIETRREGSRTVHFSIRSESCCIFFVNSGVTFSFEFEVGISLISVQNWQLAENTHVIPHKSSLNHVGYGLNCVLAS